MDPYTKGLAISNSEKIRIEHNKFAKPEPFIFSQKRRAKDDDDVFHFVAYLHFRNNVYEIDGLKEGPILISEGVTNNKWIESVKPAIMNRINLYSTNEIKFNLLSLVSDKRLKMKEIENDLICRKNHIRNILSGSDVNVF
jgi:ubiquitin carboxyl-terminal hydrolase L5